MALCVDVHDGLLLLAAVPTTRRSSTTSGRCPNVATVAGRRSGAFPRAANTCATCAPDRELEERGVDTPVSGRAGARLDIGRVVLRDGLIEITGPYGPRRCQRCAPCRSANSTPIARPRQSHQRAAERCGDSGPRRSHQRARDDAASPPRATAHGDADHTSMAGLRKSRWRGRRSAAAITGRALAAPHARTELQQPSARSRLCARHRDVRADPGRSWASAREVPGRPAMSGGGGDGSASAPSWTSRFKSGGGPRWSRLDLAPGPSCC